VIRIRCGSAPYVRYSRRCHASVVVTSNKGEKPQYLLIYPKSGMIIVD
jgi:hypothetical protein